MFIFTIILVVITYPIILFGSFVCLCLIAFLSSGHGSEPNPFVSPAKVYSVYRAAFERWHEGIKTWYKRESKR